jgi:hypothetical protein
MSLIVGTVIPVIPILFRFVVGTVFAIAVSKLKRFYSPPKSTAAKAESIRIGMFVAIIAPEHVALTASSHPTLWFYSSDVPSHTVRVSVTHPEEIESIYEQNLKIEKAGFHRIEIPNSRSSLRSGETYIFTAGILCNPSRLSESIYARVAFKKVDLSVQIREELSKASSLDQQAEIYAREGIWYDAITASSQNPVFFRYLVSQAKVYVSFDR